MEHSHTLLLIEEAFEKIQEFNYKRYVNQLENLSQNIPNIRSNGQKHIVNQILEKFGLHLMYKSRFEELVNQDYAKMSKWSSVGTFQLALKNPEKFDEVYNLLADEDSALTFDWFIKYRVAYAFLGELAGAIYPTEITKAEFFKEMNNLKHGQLINVGNFTFKSGVLETAQSWIFEQYNLDGKCEVSEGDCIIDGGALNGETSFWFLSKGAGKVYAFEPDPNSFSTLINNIKINKASDKIIPVQKILSNTNKNFTLYTTAGGGSAAIEGGNETVEGVTLDSFVEKEGSNRLDFIKLDVEGAELEVLKGAVETIKKFKPKMAISVYHKPENIITIPKFISKILPDAKFYLSHKFCNWVDTVLFVSPKKM